MFIAKLLCITNFNQNLTSKKPNLMCKIDQGVLKQIFVYHAKQTFLFILVLYVSRKHG